MYYVFVTSMLRRRGCVYVEATSYFVTTIRRSAIGYYTMSTGHLLYMRCGEKSALYRPYILKAALYAKFFRNFNFPPTYYDGRLQHITKP